MALGKSGTLFVRKGIYNIDPAYQITSNNVAALVQDTAALLGQKLSQSLETNYEPTLTTGDIPAVDKWYSICRTDMNINMSRQSVDSADSCTGTWGASTPTAPEVAITFTSHKKIGAAGTMWQAMLTQAFENAESTGPDGHVSILLLDAAPFIRKDAAAAGGDAASNLWFPGAVSFARGYILVAKVFNASEAMPFAGNIDVSYEVRPSGDSTQPVPMRTVIMPVDGGTVWAHLDT